MTRIQRRWHADLWILLGPLLLFALGTAVAIRPTRARAAPGAESRAAQQPASDGERQP